jgi:hypothetical protein
MVDVFRSEVKRGADTFIGNIPELPTPSDDFNISTLLQNDGKMTSRWINIYGVHPKNRKKYKGLKFYEGPSYLGRILISMYITPNEKP